MATKRHHSPANARQDEAQRCRQQMQRLLGSLAVHLPAQQPAFHSAFLLEYTRAVQTHSSKPPKGAT
jgi:hypothetical protein